MAISNKMSILGTKKAVLAYNGGYYLPSVSEEGILSWTPTVEGMAPIPEVNVRGPQGSDASVTAEVVQAVVPIDWDETSVALGAGATNTIEKSVVIGASAKSQNWPGVAIGYKAFQNAGGVAVGNGAEGQMGVAIGNGAKTVAYNTTAVGSNSTASGTSSTTVGYYSKAKKTGAISIGAEFSETVDDSTVRHTCSTEGTGSITIGAGANTLNTTDADGGTVESSNSVTIGCKAKNQGADSVVIGASASGTIAGSVVLGTNAGGGSVAVGSNAKASGLYSTAVGLNVKAGPSGVAIGDSAQSSTSACAVGSSAKGLSNYTTVFGMSATASGVGSVSIGGHVSTSAPRAIGIGFGAKVSDQGAAVIRSTAEDGTYTQLYFSGANTPLANTYANGEGIMGYVTTDSEGNMVASGFKRLSALFDEGTMTQPAILNEDGEWEQPKVFKPSDVDMEVEEPSEPEEYQPLPIYPIVEPGITSGEPEQVEEYQPLPVYPVVEPEIEEI